MDQRRLSVFSLFVHGHVIPLISRLSQSGPSMFWNILNCMQSETRGVQGFGVLEQNLKAEDFTKKPCAPWARVSRLKIRMKALVVFFQRAKNRLSGLNSLGDIAD